MRQILQERPREAKGKRGEGGRERLREAQRGERGQERLRVTSNEAQ